MNRRLFWQGLENLTSYGYRCGYCGESLASEKGFRATWQSDPATHARIYICHHCSRPTFFDDDAIQYPGTLHGESVKDVSDASVAKVYDEARRAYGASAYTAAVLCCRKLLMHVGVSKGAKPSGSFVSYVEFLKEHHYVPPDAAGWVDHIRSKGNEANHEIYMASKEEAEELISFCEMLMKVIFEFPATVKKKTKPSA